MVVEAKIKIIPNFGAEADAAVDAACAMFPAMFGLRNHEGTFRVSRSASYVSRGVVMVYTERLVTTRVEGGPSDGQYQDAWVDFAKGTIAELQAQIVRGPLAL